MMYQVTHPDLTRWNGEPIDPGTACGTVGGGSAVPGCPGGVHCPTCATCATDQPYGFPTLGDAAAVVESYRSFFTPAWKKFLRTVEEDQGAGVGSPYTYDLSANAVIPSTASPAVETWENGTLAIYTRGSDGNVWKKWWNINTSEWEGWSSLGTPSGSGTISDPAVVSWAEERIDLVVRRGSTIYIRTYSNGSWGTWQSLGQPASAPASAPAITSWGANRLDVFVRGSDDMLYQKTCSANCSGSSGTWSAWSAINGGTFRGKPAAVSRASGRIDVFVHGMDDELYGVGYGNGSWGSYYKVATNGTLKWDAACPDCSSPAVTARGSTILDVYIRGVDDKLWITTWTGGSTWSGYSALGGVLTSSPGTVTRLRGTNRSDIVAIMAEERTTGDWRYGAWWKEYEP